MITDVKLYKRIHGTFTHLDDFKKYHEEVGEN